MPIPAGDSTRDRVIPVHQMRPGDHAFVSYDDDEIRWDVLTAFTRLGLARGERVIVFPRPGLPEEEVLARLDFPNRTTATARIRGQLVLSSMRRLISPDPAFTADRQWSRLREETAQAVAEGYTGLRAFIDMHWVPDLGADVHTMMHRESNADDLFKGRPYSEICAYDRRWFAPEVLTAMAEAHPRNLLEQLGALHSERAPDGALRFVGEADAATKQPFLTALELALAQAAAAGRLTLDLSRLHFLSVGCAAGLLTLVQGANGLSRVEVRGDPVQLRTLQRLGAASISRLTLSEVTRPC
ncbi:MEDS domain-containing protein [Streptomyces sp. NPDC050315]|uniref:MEDS domain-containing protein n=1 Tax=Streptomyces sp. NPDC050315 TaxID=3155039 RepID=UPI00342A4B5E